MIYRMTAFSVTVNEP